MPAQPFPQGSSPVVPSHPLDWKVGIDEYLAQNDIICDKAVPLDTGTSCYLWRLEGLKDTEASANGHQQGQHVIMKCADSAPKDQAFPVAADRLFIEVRALRSQAVAEACRNEPSVQVPTVLRTTKNGFIMNWAGNTDLRTAYKTGELVDAAGVGARLGKWLGHLHVAGIAAGSQGWKPMNDELEKFYVPGGIAETFVRMATSSQEETDRTMSALRAPTTARAMTPWDFRPMNVVVRKREDDGASIDLTVVDWELCHYGETSDDVRMWFSEVLLLEAKFGDQGLLSSFLTAYKKQAGSSIVDEAFVCKVALSAGVYILFLMFINPGVWDCTEEDVGPWKEEALRYVRAGVEADLDWLGQSALKPLLHG